MVFGFFVKDAQSHLFCKSKQSILPFIYPSAGCSEAHKIEIRICTASVPAFHNTSEAKTGSVTQHPGSS